MHLFNFGNKNSSSCYNEKIQLYESSIRLRLIFIQVSQRLNIYSSHVILKCTYGLVHLIEIKTRMFISFTTINSLIKLKCLGLSEFLQASEEILKN